MAEKKFSERTFRCEKIPAKQATRLLFRLTKLAGPLMGSLTSMENDVEMLNALGGLFNALEPDAAVELLDDVLKLGQVKDVQGVYNDIIFDYVFADNLLEAFQVAAWILAVNYGDFFSAVGRKAPTLAKVASQHMT